jgi:hypothetical protein
MRHGDGDETIVATDGTAEPREAIEVLRLRAHCLASEDRALLEMYLEHGNSFRQIGRIMGLDSRNVARKVRGIVRRLMDDTYETCMGNRDEFNGRELRIIRDHFVRGLSERHISRHRAVPRYRIRAILHKARRYAASAKAPREGSMAGSIATWDRREPQSQLINRKSQGEN